MKIIVPTIGSRWDIQPYVALCQGLKRAGHSAILATHPGMRRLAEAHDVAFAPIGPDVDMARMAAEIRAKSKNWIVSMARVLSMAVALYEPSHAALMDLCRGADRVILSDSRIGAAEAELLHLRQVTVTLQPMRIPTVDPTPSLFKRLAGALWVRWQGW